MGKEKDEVVGNKETGARERRSSEEGKERAREKGQR